MTITPGRSRRVARIESVLAAGVALVFTAFAPAAGAAAPSDQDTVYAAANAQTSHAEIALADIALARSTNAETRDLAIMTKSDSSIIRSRRLTFRGTKAKTHCVSDTFHRHST